MLSRVDPFPFLAAGVGLAVSFAMMDGEFVGFGIDDAFYLLQARRFAEGDFAFRASPQFPIGYPLVLAGVVRLAPELSPGIWFWKGLSALAAAIAVALFYRLAHRHLGWSRGWALVLSLVAATASPWALSSVQLMSECFFGLATIAFLLFYLPRRETLHTSWRLTLAAGALSVIAVAIRVVGLAALTTLVLDQTWLAWRRGHRWPRARLAAVALAMVSAWTVFLDRAVLYEFRYKLLQRSESAIVHLRAHDKFGPPEIAERLALVLPRNLWRESTQHVAPVLETRFAADLDSRGPGWIATSLVRTIVSVLLVAGLVVRCRTALPLALYWSVLFVVFTLQTWPIGRYLVPLGPLSIDLVLSGASALSARLGSRAWTPAILAATALGVASGSVYRDTRRIVDARVHGCLDGAASTGFNRDVVKALGWASSRLGRGERLIATDSHLSLVYEPGRPVARDWSDNAEPLVLSEGQLALLYEFAPGDDLATVLGRETRCDPRDPLVSAIAKRLVEVYRSTDGLVRVYRAEEEETMNPMEGR